jgi:hypothetical protein
LLVKFFLNPKSSAYLRSLESEFGESTNSIRLELNKFEKADLLNSTMNGNRKMFKANERHPLFSNINGLVRKHLGIDALVEHVVKRLGGLKFVYLTGDLAKGIDTNIIDLILVGDDINRVYLTELVEKAEKLIDRKIRFAIYSIEEHESARMEIEKEGGLLVFNG